MLEGAHNSLLSAVPSMTGSEGCSSAKLFLSWVGPALPQLWELGRTTSANLIT